VTLFLDDEIASAQQHADVVDLFAGPGGWSEALALHGIAEVGIELNPWACSTRRSAGHLTVEASVSDMTPQSFSFPRGLIASPPCQAFSTAGRRAGIAVADQLRIAIEIGDWSARPSSDSRVWLPLEVGRWIDAAWPEWVLLEQVPSALPLWESYAAYLSGCGYSVWSGIVNAADYGVPQTRRRAVLIASASIAVNRPAATHSATGEDDLPQWITMADALGDPERRLPWLVNTGRAWNQAAGGGAQVVDGSRYPAPTFTTKSGSQWNIGNGERGGDSRRISVADALILQSFRSDYPVRGSLADQFEQIGNAVPPRLALALLQCVEGAQA
jgi:DNA (cytosine-5)-methyltransferase 1